MTDNNHPITPSPEMLQQWFIEYWGEPGQTIGASEKYIAIEAARWGADQELEACCEWLDNYLLAPKGSQLRDARRPKPPSLAEEALEALNEADQGLNESEWRPRSNAIRRALERLRELEGEQSPRS